MEIVINDKKLCVGDKIICISGSNGTGKTTLLLNILDALKKKNAKYNILCVTQRIINSIALENTLKKCNVIAIDNFGNDLDFCLAKKFIEIIKKNKCICVFTSLNKTIINNIKLKDIIILDKTHIYTYKTDKHLYDEHEDTGLNNMDFINGFIMNDYVKEE